MRCKKILFSVLENIENKKIEQQKIYIKCLYIQKRKYIKQLKLLISFRNEYIKKLNIKLKLGIFIDYWKIYNDFIFMLYTAIEENNNFIKEYEKKIKKNIDQFFMSHIKLKTWNYLNDKNKILLNNHQILQENIISDELSQFKFFKKGSY